MVATNSQMLSLGTKAPYFNLQDSISGEYVSRIEKNLAKGCLVAFICNHCPYVIHLIKHVAENVNPLIREGLCAYAISSNDIGKYPLDSPEKMKLLAHTNHFNFPYLHDKTQEVAISYSASCTPDFFLFDTNLKLFYRGRYDESRPGSNKPVDGKDLLHATEMLLEGQPPPLKQSPSIGCNIKWLEGREPTYFKS